MHHCHLPDETFSSGSLTELWSTRRQVLLASLLAAVPLALSDTAALASKIDPSETQVTLQFSGAVGSRVSRRTALRWPRSTAAWISQGRT